MVYEYEYGSSNTGGIYCPFKLVAYTSLHTYLFMCPGSPSLEHIAFDWIYSGLTSLSTHNLGYIMKGSAYLCFESSFRLFETGQNYLGINSYRTIFTKDDTKSFIKTVGVISI